MTGVPTVSLQNLASFSRDRFVGYDFDGTQALTSVPSPNNVTVESAYEVAIGGIFGSKALDTYRAMGGLRNRAPVDVVRQLAPDAYDAEQAELLTRLDSAKLDVLVAEISPQWPQPTNGYLDFAHRLQASRNLGAQITDATISSGHKSFISRTFDAWGVPQPTIMLAQEAIGAMAAANKMKIPTKPSITIVRFAHNAWRALYGLSPVSVIPFETAIRMNYIGDDSDKDGLMARNAGVPFRLFRLGEAENTWNSLAQELGLASVHEAVQYE